MKRLIALTLASCAIASPSLSYETIHDGVAPILSSSNAEQIPNSYIVKFKKHVTESKANDHHLWVQSIHESRESERMELRKRGIIDDIFHGLKHTYKIGDGFLGYSGHFDESVIEQVRRHPDVSLDISTPFFYPSALAPSWILLHPALLAPVCVRRLLCNRSRLQQGILHTGLGSPVATLASRGPIHLHGPVLPQRHPGDSL